METKAEDTFSVEPLATPYRMIFSVDKEKLEKEISEFWEKNGQDLAKATGYKGKKHKGGTLDLKKARESIEKSFKAKRLYGNILSEFVVAKIKEEYEEKNERCMYISDINLDKKDPENPLILCMFYFWSKLHFDGEIDYNVKEMPNWDLEKEFGNRCKQLQLSHKISTEVTPEALTEDNEVLLDIIASCEGKACEDKTFRGVTHRIGNLQIPELKEELLKHKSGDLFEMSYVSQQEDSYKDKELSLHVKIFQVFDISYTDIDDDELYKKENFETKEEFRKSFEEQFTRYIDQARRSVSFDHVINQLAMGGQFDNLPQGWIEMRAKSFKDQHMQHFNGDEEKARKSLGVKPGQPIERAFEGRVLREAVNQMAIFAYCDLEGIDTDAEKVADHILTKVTWTKPE
ncbi:hypothetical protein N8Z24_00090 [bacterium]|nr:hypothetical protein [bacterium]